MGRETESRWWLSRKEREIKYQRREPFAVGKKEKKGKGRKVKGAGSGRKKRKREAGLGGEQTRGARVRRKELEA